MIFSYFFCYLELMTVHINILIVLIPKLEVLILSQKFFMSLYSVKGIS